MVLCGAQADDQGGHARLCDSRYAYAPRETHYFRQIRACQDPVGWAQVGPSEVARPVWSSRPHSVSGAVWSGHGGSLRRGGGGSIGLAWGGRGGGEIGGWGRCSWSAGVALLRC